MPLGCHSSLCPACGSTQGLWTVSLSVQELLNLMVGELARPLALPPAESLCRSPLPPGSFLLCTGRQSHLVSNCSSGRWDRITEVGPLLW